MNVATCGLLDLETMRAYASVDDAARSLGVSVREVRALAAVGWLVVVALPCF